MLTLAPICDEVKGGNRHHNNPHDEVSHGETHDEHVGHCLQPPLCPVCEIDRTVLDFKDCKRISELNL